MSQTWCGCRGPLLTCWEHLPILGCRSGSEEQKATVEEYFLSDLHHPRNRVNYASVIDHKGQLVANQCAVLIILIYKQLILFVEQGRAICWGISCSRVFEKSLRGEQTDGTTSFYSVHLHTKFFSVGTTDVTSCRHLACKTVFSTWFKLVLWGSTTRLFMIKTYSNTIL